MTQKYKISFINEGKPFVMPKWSVGKHKAALAQLLNDNPNATDDEKMDLFNVYVIYQTVKQIDPSVSIDSIKEMHPEDQIQLFNAVYNEGREGIFFVEGEEPNPKPVKKSTGKKS